MKMLWSGICPIVNFKSDVGCSISSLTHDGFKVDDSKKWLTYLMKYLLILHKKINKKIPRTRKSPLDYLSSKNGESFFISPVTPHEIKVINSMKSGKAVGPYSIPIFLLKILCEHIAIPLCDTINNFFSSGVFPDMMKLAKVIPLYKKDSPEVYSTITLRKDPKCFHRVFMLFSF